MDRRGFFGTCAAAVVGALFPKPRQLTQGEIPWLVIRHVEFIRDEIPFDFSDEFQRLNTALPTYEGRSARFSVYDL